MLLKHQKFRWSYVLHPRFFDQMEPACILQMLRISLGKLVYFRIVNINIEKP